jgi:hypothetical protein
MNLSKKSFALILATVIFLSFSSGYVAYQYDVQHRPARAKSNIFVFRETPSGRDLIASGNTITDIGENYARDVLSFDNVTSNNATHWISLGNSSVASTKTKLDTEATNNGFERKVADSEVGWIYSGDYAVNYTVLFTATAQMYVNSAGLQWSGVSNSDNNLYALASLGGSQEFEATWNCTIVWMIVYDFN